MQIFYPITTVSCSKLLVKIKTPYSGGFITLQVAFFWMFLTIIIIYKKCQRCSWTCTFDKQK